MIRGGLSSIRDVTGMYPAETPCNERRTRPHGAGKQCNPLTFMIRDADTLCAGAVRHGAAHCVRRVRKLYTRDVANKTFTAL